MTALMEHFEALDYDRMDEMRLFVERGGSWEETTPHRDLVVTTSIHHPPMLTVDGVVDKVHRWRVFRGRELLIAGEPFAP